MNILYIGSSGALSVIPFKKLLGLEHSIVAVGVYQPVIFEHKLIVLENASLALLAKQHDIELIDLSLSFADIKRQCQASKVDVILMSCYSKRLAKEVSALAKYGCFNMHPSLLPEYRGPEPIFWQFKEGADTGVSWHHVTEDFDAGDIVKQKTIAIDDGVSHEDISSEMAKAGSALMEELLTDLSASTLSAKRQESSLSSYYHYPKAQDFVVDLTVPARQVFNFMRATEKIGYAYPCQIGEHQYLLGKALDYDNNDSLQDAVVDGDTLSLPCGEGVLIATFAGKL